MATWASGEGAAGDGITCILASPDGIGRRAHCGGGGRRRRRRRGNGCNRGCRCRCLHSRRGGAGAGALVALSTSISISSARPRGSLCGFGWLLVSGGNPILRRERDPPNISCALQIPRQSGTVRALSAAVAPTPRALARLAAGKQVPCEGFPGNHGIFRDVMLRLVFAPVAVHHYGRGSLFEWLAERVDAGDGNRYRLRDACAATLLLAGFGRRERLSHVIPPERENF